MRSTPRNPVALAGSVVGAMALLDFGPWQPGWLLFKQNRLVEGDALGAFGTNPGAAGLLLAFWLTAALLALAPWPGRGWLLAALASAALVVTLAFVGGAARELTEGAPRSARVSLQGGVWLTLLAYYVVTFGALNDAPRRSATRLLLIGPGLLVAAWLIMSGALSELGLAREFASQGSDFRAELARHLALAGTSLLVAGLIGIPAAIASARNPSVARFVLPAAGLVQTLPSLALFGLLVSPLAQLGRVLTVGGALRIALLGLVPLLLLAVLRRLRPRKARTAATPWWAALRGLLLLIPVAPGALVAVVLAVVVNGVLAALLGGGSAPQWPGGDAPLADLGVRGIGSAPALIALTLYALLPIVRNTYTGLMGVPKAATDAGIGMGMSPRQLLLRVQLPLALPLIVEGVRAAAVLTIGTTTVAYLIGAGGLGVFIQRGIDQVVPDLVLLGAVPIIVLALLADALLRGLGKALTPRGVREPAPNAVAPVGA